MRSTFAAAAFVAGAIAVPFQKRDVVTDIDMTYVTQVVTVIGGEEVATSTSAASVVQAAHFGHHSWHAESSSTEIAPVVTTVVVEPSSTEAAPTSTSTSVYVAPIPTTSSSVYVAPIPTTSSSVWIAPSSSTSEYVAPIITTSATSEYVAPSSTSSEVESTTESSSSSVPTSYEEIVVYHHNIHRANHSAPDIAWSDDLASTAATIASSCVYAHDTTTNGGGYGQNIAAGVEANNISAIITDMFYNGEVGWFDGLYGQANPSENFENWGHFSQIVWKASTSVGCATQYCSGGLANVGSDVSPYFTVCNYESPGNFGGEYADNIGEPLGYATAQWNAGGIS